jgi:nicotinamidase-related amidase
MADITLPVRYYTLGPEADEAFDEKYFHFSHIDLTIPAEQLGIVLVDCWNNHPYESHLQRTSQISETVLAPVVDACRELGIAVIHAPSPGQARLYPQWTKYASEADLFSSDEPNAQWPPAAMRNRCGAYVQYAKPQHPRLKQWLETDLPKRRIATCLEPQPDDFVIATGGQLHRLCRHQGIMHLLYAGFAANMCVPGRDYGTRAMKALGYNTILLRDGTTAIEAAHTLDGMWLTEAAIVDQEMNIGFSATSAELLTAFAAARGQ